MKVIKEAMMKWLDEEIEKERNTPYFVHGDSPTRLNTLIEVKSKLSEVIVEEFHKLSQDNENA